jgi:hypothetical protein
MVGTGCGVLVNVGVRAGAGVDVEAGVGVRVRSNGRPGRHADTIETMTIVITSRVVRVFISE